MVPEPLKFRCDRCGQLLGVSPSRAGRPVKCPKCGAGLVVPSPDARTEEDLGGSDAPPNESGMPLGRPAGGGAPAGSPGFFDGIDLDPDDLRTLFPTDSEDSIPLPGGKSETAQTEEESGESPGIQLPFRTDPDPIARGPIETTDPVPVFSFEPEPAEPATIEAGPQLSTLTGDADVAIPRARTGRDVVMPRVAVVAWSLFVLFALFLAFTAGLLAGHFVWIEAG